VSRAAPAAPDPDWEILRRVATGEVEAFSGLVERHQERIFAVCRRLLFDAEEARDAAQEVFLRAYRTAGSFRPQGQVFTWLYRIAVNYCLNRLRRRRLARFVPLLGSGEEPEAGAVHEPADPRPGAGAVAESRERWQALRRAIARLPPGQRAVLVLAKFEGLAQREIAAALGISEGAVESRLVRAMRSLTAADAQEG
jgi:RNA polymerase sigma-70 factor (ECF subfamily)